MVMRLVPQDELLDEEEIQALEEQALQADARRVSEEEEVAEASDGAVEDAAEDAQGADGAAATEPAVDSALMEALLLSTHHPLTAGRLAELLDLESTKPIRKAVKQLNEQYQSAGRAFRIEQVAGGFQILTLPEFGDALKKLHQKEADAKLTKAAMETLAIIAYKQPILRADVEAIRGCACGETIRSLMEKHLVKIAGRAEEPGRPILYGTTKRFLELFGLNNLRDLPQPDAAKPQA
jgi:segregation and condensation protein B